MSLLDEFPRVSRQRPCPICGSPDWCLLAADGHAAICARVVSEHMWGDAGYFHRLGPSSRRASSTKTIALDAAPTPKPELREAAISFISDCTPEQRRQLARSLGVSSTSLARLGVGWSSQHAAFTFPMCNAAGGVMGIRLRAEDGRKGSVTGGHHGLHIPAKLGRPSTLLLTEGPTDCAALLDLGFAAVGRPSCTGGTAVTLEFVKRFRPELVVVVSDSDGAGLLGAANLAGFLALRVQVKVITPPNEIKDARAWRIAGATAQDVTAAITAAPPHIVSLSPDHEVTR